MNYKNKVFKCSKVKFDLADYYAEIQNRISGESTESTDDLTKEWRIFLKFKKKEIWYKAEWKTPWTDTTLWIGGNYIALVRSL